MSEDRIAALEEAVAHGERQIEDLGSVVQELWGEIARLKREIGRLEAAMDAAGEDHGRDPPPPHY